ncbi:hypothetical protein SADUNF_Sadunf15G0009800 [Salix dunnii]|uniref:MBD domain-containing protein n=1 Tax=Salix dunnii TaxID=1413687 RepID=A0A835MI37_9ROSI|nr:hypothetical protein SADUNF_Sadunf15G0009800 [Salix dunnii]
MEESPYICDKNPVVSRDDPANIKMDAYYITLIGKKLRTCSEIATFIEANPKYQDDFRGDSKGMENAYD